MTNSEMEEKNKSGFLVNHNMEVAYDGKIIKSSDLMENLYSQCILWAA